MSSQVTLSAGVRQNLLALQNTAALLSTTQQRLATGKKVNSALDNPSNFFTSQSLSNRANDLSALLDSIGQAQQTLNAADQGITSLTNLVQSAKSIANQALQAPLGTVSYTAITGTTPIVADSTQVSSTGTVAAAVTASTKSTQSAVTLTAAGITNLSNGETLTFKLGSGATQTATYTTGVASGASFHTVTDLQGVLSPDFTGTAAAAVVGGNSVVLTSNDLTNNFAIGGTGLAHAQTVPTDFQTNVASLGDALTITDGAGHSASFYTVAGNASASNGTFSDAASLVSAVNNGASAVHALITATNPGAGTGLTLASPSSVTVGAGTIGTTLGFGVGALALSTNANFNTTLNSLSGSLTVGVGSNTAHTITFGSGAGQVNTKAALTTAFAGFTDITAGFNGSGDIVFTPQSSDTVTIGGTPAAVTGVGLSLGVTTPIATVVTPNATRANLQSQYNALLQQIDQLAGDASYNGINLLNGDNLKVVFNENASSSLTIQGVKFNSLGLGLSPIIGNGFQDNHNVNTTLDGVQGALTTLRAQASAFGSNETTVEARQDFTKNLVSTLQTGSDNLVLADTNQEGANLLALQTRQQLSITSLSLASQADQAILKVL
jgi:flagellin-like hook-associated protein FlgL